MSAIISMPTAIDESIKGMCVEAVSQAVAALAEKYGFDAEEAERELNLGELKMQRKRGPAPKAKADTKAKAKKEAGDKPKAKRAATGYLTYAASVRAETKEELQAEVEDGEKLKPQAVVTAIAAKWKALTEDERTEWNEVAKEAAAGEESE